MSTTRTIRPRGRRQTLVLVLGLGLGLGTLGPLGPDRPARAEPPGATGEIRRFEGTTDQVLDVAFMADGRKILAATGVINGPGKDHSVWIWDAETGKELLRFAGHEKSVHCVAVAPDGKQIASGALDETVQLWDPETGKVFESRHVHRAVVLDVAFSPDGRRAITGSWDYQPMDYWDVASRASVHKFGVGAAPVTSVAFTPDGRQVLTGHADKLLRLWDLETAKEVRRFEGHEGSVHAVALSADGRLALSAGADKLVRLWDVETGKQTRKFEGSDKPVFCVAFAPNGRRALSGGDDHLVWLWNVDTGAALAQFEGHTAAVRAVAFAPDGRRGLSGGADKTARLWDLAVTAEEARKTLAVLDFADLGPSVELAVLRKALAEMLVGDLSREAGLRVVERGQVEHVMSEAGLGKAGLIDAATARRAGSELAADYLLTGSIAGTNEKVSVKAALTRPGAAKAAGEWLVEGPSDKLFDLERDLAAKVRASLGLGDGSPKPAPTVAVLGFKDLSPAPRMKEMESGFSEILQTEMAGLEGLRLVERSKLDALLREQKLSLSGLVAADSAAKVGRLLGAERMIFGSFIELGTNLRVEARLVDVETAAVLHAETAQGPTEKFAELFEDLARKLASDLTATPSTAQPKPKRATGRARGLEAARHFASGREWLRQGRNPDAAAAFERVLLLEPDNLDAHFWRIDGWMKAANYEKAIVAAREGLNRKFTPAQQWAKDSFQNSLAYCYVYTHQHDKHQELIQQIEAETPKVPSSDGATLIKVKDLLARGRRREGIDLLKTLLARSNGPVNRAKFDDCLRSAFYEVRNGAESASDVQAEIALTAEVLDLMLKGAEDRRDAAWNNYAELFPDAIRTSFRVSGKRESEFLLSPEKQAVALERLIKIFHDLPRVQWTAQLALAKNQESVGRWKEAREAYLYVAGHLNAVPHQGLPWPWDVSISYRNHWLNEVIPARVRAAEMLDGPLGDKPRAVAEFKSILHDYGMAHQQGARVGQRLQERGEPVEFPKKAALIVGGGGDAWRSWGFVLSPLGYTAHPYDLAMLTAANLAPYSLVVLARQGGLAFEPSEILALRSYVATGGSLLVVVTPGWSYAQPGVLNPLLAFFGVHAHHDSLPVRVWGNLSDDHPLVKGLERKGQMAKRAVELDAPRESMAVRWYEKKILVAVPYREGRVVVSSFGQWLLPDIRDQGEWWERTNGLHNWGMIDEAPMEARESSMLPLLKNALAWLDEPIAGRPEGRRLSEDFLKAHHAALEMLYRLRSRDELAHALDAFVAGAGSGERREEALWVAGESLRPLQWFGSNHAEMHYAWKSEIGPPRLDPRSFEELLRAYPKSPLAPFAQWDAAEFDRLNRVYDIFREHGGWVDVPIDAEASAQRFEKVEAAKGSYAWAWTRLRLGLLYTQAVQPARALENARAVADALDVGPEKTLALFQAAGALKRLGQTQQAARYLQAAADVPEVFFPNEREDSAWAPVSLAKGNHRIRFVALPTRYLAKEWGKSLETPAP